MRYFNTEGSCNPEEHYMVQLDDRLEKIKKLYVDMKKYFVINKGRQYGKTTTLKALAAYLHNDYFVISIDFQEIGSEDFADTEKFVCAFTRKFLAAFPEAGKNMKNKSLTLLTDFVDTSANKSMLELFIRLSAVCKEAQKPIVLIIDEVDSASNNQVFMDFLSQLRGYFLDREKKDTFHSVILAGVYDIKNLKLKIRPEAERRYNSPWNIAADFTIDMSFSTSQIATMLNEYKADKHIKMDAERIAKNIFDYTSGYPYLVSAICKLIDDNKNIHKENFDSEESWSTEDILDAVKTLVNKPLPLFQSMIRQINEYPDLKKMLHALLFQGKRITFNTDNPVIELAAMFGYVVDCGGSIQVANRIFEMRLYGYFLSEEELTSAIYDEAQGEKNSYIQDGKLDMELVLKKFVQHFTDIYGDNDEKFLETCGRKLFLLYLKPIINGTGNYYVEAQTRDARRTDIIVDYLGEQFIVELKIWRGSEYNERGEAQLADYLDYFHSEKGYLISFNFNKKKEIGVKEIKIKDKTIVEAVV